MTSPANEVEFTHEIEIMTGIVSERKGEGERERQRELSTYHKSMMMGLSICTVKQKCIKNKKPYHLHHGRVLLNGIRWFQVQNGFLPFYGCLLSIAFLICFSRCFSCGWHKIQMDPYTIEIAFGFLNLDVE